MFSTEHKHFITDATDATDPLNFQPQVSLC